MPKLVFVLLDGLNYATAARHMCYMRALFQAGNAAFFCLHSQLPPLSRPVYATLLTGLAPLQHGILCNDDHRTAPSPNIFTTLAESGLRICVGAYAWFYELCQGEIFIPSAHRLWQPAAGPIQAGMFYASDNYPDAELFADCEALRKQYEPDFLLVHSMGIDQVGHCHGGDSPEYAAAAAQADALLAAYVPIWRHAGYDLLVCSDHGMAAGGSHYACERSVMDVPLWLAGENWNNWNDRCAPAQTDIAAMTTAFFGLENIPRPAMTIGLTARDSGHRKICG